MVVASIPLSLTFTHSIKHTVSRPVSVDPQRQGRVGEPNDRRRGGSKRTVCDLVGVEFAPAAGNTGSRMVFVGPSSA